MQILLTGWFLDDDLRAALLGEAGQPELRHLHGVALHDAGAFRPPYLLPTKGASAPALMWDLPISGALFEWLASGFGAQETEQGFVLGAGQGGSPDAPQFAPQSIAAMRSDLVAACREFAAQAGKWPRENAPTHLFGARQRAWAYARAQTPDIQHPRPIDATPTDVVITPVDHGFFAVDRIAMRVPHFDGGYGERVTRTTWRGMDAALVLPYDPIRDVVVIVEQFRFGPFVRGDINAWKYEPVAGVIDPGETAQEAAHREMIEETGLEPRTLISCLKGYSTPGYVTDFMENFIGLCDIPDRETWVSGLAHEGENIRSHVMAFADAMALLDRGEIDVMPLQLLLLELARKRDALRLAAHDKPA